MIDPIPEQKRRLAAVVFTDVVGYSTRMQRDESATISGVEVDLARMRTLCLEHGGEVLNSMGDGLMLCFSSAVKGVEFALKVQGELVARKSSSPDAMEHRIGIHLGDVISLESGGVAGDGVNIASRLEAKAPPGGICISQTVYDTVKGKVPMRATFVGPEHFKNIAEPILVWHINPEGTVGTAETHTFKSRTRAPGRSSPRWLIATISVILVIAVAAVGGIWSRRDRFSGNTADKAALADSKSIAVLPFTNMSDNKENGYFADGMQEELLTQLALLGELKVVSRTSVMDYRDTKKNIRQIGTELGVRTLVEGSVRRAGDIVRVTVQLIDAGSDKHLWAKSYERKLKDTFAIQNELATEIARALKVSLSPHDQARLSNRKPTENVPAYDLYLRYQKLVNDSKGTYRAGSSIKERIELLSQVVELDPAFALAWAKLGAEHARAYFTLIDRRTSRRMQAKQAVERALTLAPNDIEVMIEEANFYLYGNNDNVRAAKSLEIVLRVAPNNVDARLQLAFIRRRELKYAEVAAQLEKVLAIDARNVGALNSFANLLFDFRNFDRALAVQQQLINIRPDDVDLQGKYQRIEYSKTGTWDSFDKWRSTLPLGAARMSGRVWRLDVERAIARRDFDGVTRLLDVAPEEVLNGEWDKLSLNLMKAMVLLARGDRSRGLVIARIVQDQAAHELRRRPDDPELLLWSYLSHAILGNREKTLAENQRAYTLAAANKDPWRAEFIHRDLLSLHALLGDRREALQELSRQLKLPESFPTDYRGDLSLSSLWDDPEFQTMVNDPANNAPVPFDFQYPPVATK